MKNMRPIIQAFALIICAATLAGCPCQTIDGPGEPAISLTFVPPIGSFADLEGQVSHVNVCDYEIAVYIGFESIIGTDPTGLFGSRIIQEYWSKPTFEEPLTPILFDGSFQVDITTGGIDEMANIIAVFVLPAGYLPPLLAGDPELPDELFANSLSYTMTTRFEEGK